MKGRFLNTSILTDLVDEEFDFAVAVGSLHHTGNVEIALTNLEKLIKLGGTSLVMVYNEFEYTRIMGRPILSISNYFRSLMGSQLVFAENDRSWRGRNDVNSVGEPAPFTSYQSHKFFYSENRLCEYSVQKENFHSFSLFGKRISRDFLLNYPSRVLGTDLYAKGIKIKQ